MLGGRWGWTEAGEGKARRVRRREKSRGFIENNVFTNLGPMLRSWTAGGGGDYEEDEEYDDEGRGGSWEAALAQAPCSPTLNPGESVGRAFQPTPTGLDGIAQGRALGIGPQGISSP
jgi:hypothetical protein